jgi:hypothetical protein
MLLLPASESDIPAIKCLSEGIWDGGDYLPRLIADWIREGGVYIGVVNGEVVGVSRIRKMADDEWWLEGLRIAIIHQGCGYGKELHNLTLEELKRIGKGIVRFASADTNRSIPPALKSGFREILRLPFTYAELPHNQTIKNPWHAVLEQNGVAIIQEPSSQVRNIIKTACQEDYAGLIRKGWEFYNFTEERLSSWLGQSTVLGSTGATGVTAVTVIATDYERPGNLDLNLLAGDEAAVRDQIIPSLVAAAMMQPERFNGLYACVPARYHDVLISAGFQLADFFHDQIVFAAEIAKLVPAS